MNYVVYNASSGVISQYMEIPGELAESPLPGLVLLAVAERLSPPLNRYLVIDGVLTLLPELPVYASANDIRNKWLQMEAAPVEVGGHMLDCDPKSTDRMAGCLAAWDSLPLEPGQIEETGGVRRVFWTLADNTKVGFTKAELQSLLDSLVLARAVRGSRIYAAFQRLKVRSDVTLAELNDDLTWV
jgi:hypothetical protein